MLLERKVYSQWAFKEDATAMAKINREIYAELYPKVKMCHIDWFTKKPNYTEEDLQTYCCVKYVESGYGTQTYQVLSNPYGFTDEELALISDGGNLCFGYRKYGADMFIVYTD